MTTRKDFDELDEFDRFDDSAPASGARPSLDKEMPSSESRDDGWGGLDDEDGLNASASKPSSKSSDERDRDDAQDDAAAYDAWDRESAFADEPLQVVEEVKDGEPESAQEDWTASGDEAPLGSAAGGAGKANKPNPVILGAAAVMGLAVLGGAGWMGWNMLSSGGNAGPAVAMVPPAPTPAGASGSDAFLMPGQIGSDAGADVGAAGLDDWDDDADAVSMTADAAPASSGPDSPEPTPTPTAAAASAAAVAQASAEPVSASSAPQAATPAPSASAAPGRASSTTASSTTNSSRERRVSTASASGSASRPAAPVSREEFVGDQRVRVVAVYPHSGRHTQAWLRDEATGATHAVRTGDTFRGARVREIQPDQMRVVLEDGRRFGVRGLESVAAAR